MTRPSRLILARRFAETLVFAVAGGAALGLPGLPAGMAVGRDPVHGRGRPGQAACVCSAKPLARVTFVVLGISLGAAVTPDVVSRIATWPVSMAVLALAMSCSTFCVALYLNRVHGWDSMSSLFAAAPGRAVAGLGARRRYLGRSALGRDRAVRARPCAGGGSAACHCRARNDRHATGAVCRCRPCAKASANSHCS